jgi:hypothetical protein
MPGISGVEQRASVRRCPRCQRSLQARIIKGRDVVLCPSHGPLDEMILEQEPAEKRFPFTPADQVKPSTFAAMLQRQLEIPPAGLPPEAARAPQAVSPPAETPKTAAAVKRK